MEAAIAFLRMGKDHRPALAIVYKAYQHTYEGPHDVHALILGRAITGIAAF
ncbi:hypothetical protein [Sphingorhabdus sp.]|uniref:hypothetical protein n=1 Tax=Sphingorhabdus sp. TaxID=1902408 RepID=UPI0037CAA306